MKREECFCEYKGRNRIKAIVDCLCRNVWTKGCQRSNIGRRKPMVHIFSEGAISIVDPYADSLAREPSVDHQIQIVIAVDVDRSDGHSESVGMGECEGAGLSLAQLQFNAILISVCCTGNVSADSQVDFLIAIQISNNPSGSKRSVKLRQRLECLWG